MKWFCIVKKTLNQNFRKLLAVVWNRIVKFKSRSIKTYLLQKIFRHNELSRWKIWALKYLQVVLYFILQKLEALELWYFFLFDFKFITVHCCDTIWATEHSACPRKSCLDRLLCSLSISYTSNLFEHNAIILIKLS